MPEVTRRRSPAAARGRLAAAGGIIVLAASALFGGNLFGVRDDLLGTGVPSARSAAVSPFVAVRSHSRGPQTVLRSQPWWQRVVQLHGQAGRTVRTVVVEPGAIQWRARWSCSDGSLVVRMTGNRNPLIDTECPARGTASETKPGRFSLAVDAGGAWKLRIDQQVDVPLVEPALPSMTAPGSSVVAAGAFERIDQFASGSVTVYRLASGRYAMRFKSFYVTPNVDLQVRLSPLRSPRSTRQYLGAHSAYVAPLPITAGSLNFFLPRGLDPRLYHSVVIWCPLVTSAYAEASLAPAR